MSEEKSESWADITERLDSLSTEEGKEELEEQEDRFNRVSLVTGLFGEADIKDVVVEQSDPNSPLFSVGKFEDLNLKPELLKGVYAMGFNKPSKIQERALPLLLANPPQNLIGQAQSGTGKTAAFTLSVLSRIDSTVASPQAICISPTRELARQTASVIENMGQFLPNSKPFLAIPAEKTEKPVAVSRVTSPVVVGTPGKITDLNKRRAIDFNRIKIFVLDEADVLLEAQNLGNQVRQILKRLPKGCQILCFSATYRQEILRWAENNIPKPYAKLILKVQELRLEKLKTFYLKCNPANKFKMLCDLYDCMTISQSVIFVRLRKTAQELTDAMRKANHTVSVIHGADMPVSERDKVIDDFRAGKTRVLIGTDVISRGIDVLQVSLVINYDLPVRQNGSADVETYIHRVGRSARFGRAGVAINFVEDQKSQQVLDEIKSVYNLTVNELRTDDVEVLSDALRKIKPS